MGMMGHTQGVNKAMNPPMIPAMKINHKEASPEVPVCEPKARNSSITGRQ